MGCQHAWHDGWRDGSAAHLCSTAGLRLGCCLMHFRGLLVMLKLSHACQDAAAVLQAGGANEGDQRGSLGSTLNTAVCKHAVGRQSVAVLVEILEAPERLEHQACACGIKRQAHSKKCQQNLGLPRYRCCSTVQRRLRRH